MATMNWTMRVIFLTGMVVHLSVLSVLSELDLRQKGVCSVSVKKREYKNSSSRSCEEPFSRPCSGEETKEQNPPPGYICCSKRNKTPLEVPGCCSNWVYNKITDKCEAKCERGCVGGRCVEPDKCACDPPLILDSTNTTCVQPVCDPACVNGECVGTNLCKCNSSFTPYNKTHCGPNCGKGLVNDPTTLKCVAKCDPPGFELKDGSCVPVCNQPCLNGTCSAPDKCKCDPGYTLDKGVCTPIKPEEPPEEPVAEGVQADGTSMAGLELTWTLGGAVVLLLVILLVAVMIRLYRKRKLEEKENANRTDHHGSVIYTVPDTLLQHNENDNDDDSDGEEKDVEKFLSLPKNQEL